MLPEIKRLDSFDDGIGPLLRFPVIRDDTRSGILSFLLDLLRSLQDREIELGNQGLVWPLRPFLIVVPELGGPRHDQDKDHEKHGQGDETVFELGQFQIHNKLSII